MRPPSLFIVLLLSSTVVHAATSIETIDMLGDATVTHDSQAGTWTIGAGGAALTMTLDAARDFQITSLIGSSGRNWIVTPDAGTFVTANGAPLPFGNRAAGFEYESATTSNDGHLVRLDARFFLRSANLHVTRHVAAANGSPTFEMWTTYESATGVTLSNLNAFRLTVPAGDVHWLNGLQGDTADAEHDSAFTLQHQQLASGETLTLGAQGRSSEQTVPWLAVDGDLDQDQFYAALLWSGAWSLTAARAGSGLTLTLSLGQMTTTVTGAVEVQGPHAILGVSGGGASGVASALRTYIIHGIRGGREMTPLVTYNTWFAYGTEIDDVSMRAEMDRAASLGVELFVIDAGWYVGAGAAGSNDFDAGLGTWEVDPARFPDGLNALTDYAHGLGMKFGIWVEPEHVNLSTVGAPGIDERLLATHGGEYGSEHTAQICLASTAAREWVWGRLTAFIDSVQPDYLKWDNNIWVNCDRAGHGHGAADGNFAHVTALYGMLSSLRDRYPNLLIENVSGGGNRLDFGMARYTDVAWMDDRTAPSVHVRHNVQGLIAAFPPEYLLSFVVDHETEPVYAAPDLSLYVRSRMVGALGLCVLTGYLSEGESAEITREIDVYKLLRSTVIGAAGTLLTAQATSESGPAWDVSQASAAGGDAFVLYAFQSDEGASRVTVKPTGLRADATYRVTSVDLGLLGEATGADLMAQGIDVLGSPNSAAHILTLVVKE